MTATDDLENTATLTLMLISSPLSCAYSITSSHGPSFEYEPFNPSTQLTRTSTTDSPLRLYQNPNPNQHYTSKSSSSSSPSQSQPPQLQLQQQQPFPLFFSANSDSAKDIINSDSEYNFERDSIYTSNNDNRNHNNNDNNNNNYGGDPSTPQHIQFTPTQRQVASRIYFESRLTTPKPLLGFRSFQSSYRNRNYYVKKNQGNQYESSFLPSHGDNYFKFHPTNNNDQQQTQQQNNNNKGPRPQIIFNGEAPPRENPRLFPSASNNSGSTSLHNVNKETDRVIPPWNVLIPAEEPLHPVIVTTPESKTAPATVLIPSSSSATDRPSSTQQMQVQGGEPFYSTSSLTGSESNNHYQFNRNEQWFGPAEVVKRPVQISPPPPSTSTSTIISTGHQHPQFGYGQDHQPGFKKPGKVGKNKESSRHYGQQQPQGDSEEEDYEGEGVDGDGDGYLDTTSQYFTEGQGQVAKGIEDDKEEPIFFPATVKPTQRTYKIPEGGGGREAGNVWEDSELAGLKNILELRNGSNGTEAYDNGTAKKPSIIFPKDSFIPVQEGAKDPACAKKLGYCDKFDSYPKELLNNVLTNSISSDVFQKVFGDEIGYQKGSHHDALDHSGDVVLAGRNGLTQETPLCTSQEVTIYPRVARNKDDKWMFIVNHDDYVQGVKVEKCMKEGSSCLFSEGNPLGYESVCRQKFILRKLVALNGEGKTALDTFKLPSCCVCYIKSNFVSERIGSLSSASSSATLSDTIPSHHSHNVDAHDGEADTVDGISSSSSKVVSESPIFNSSLSTSSYSPSYHSNSTTTATAATTTSTTTTTTTPELILSRSKNATEYNRTLT